MKKLYVLGEIYNLDDRDNMTALMARVDDLKTRGNAGDLTLVCYALFRGLHECHHDRQRLQELAEQLASERDRMREKAFYEKGRADQ